MFVYVFVFAFPLSGVPDTSATASATTPLAAIPTWTQVLQQQALGTARVAAASLLEEAAAAAGASGGGAVSVVTATDSTCTPTTQQQLVLEAAGSAQFVAPAPLLHPVTHIRLGLQEAQLQRQAAGSCAYRLVLGGGAGC